MTTSIIYGLLILLILAGLFGLFFCREYLKKISCLSVAYSSFVILIVVMALKNALLNEVLVIIVSILAVFAVNLLIGIAIIKNIAEAKKADQKKL